MIPLERAARAIVDNYPLDSGESPLSWQEVLPVARAVIAAIREPSDAMWEAGDAVVDHNAIGAYQAMIDAILEKA